MNNTSINSVINIITFNDNKCQFHANQLKTALKSISKSDEIALISMAGPAGERKTFFANCLLNYLRSQQKSNWPNAENTAVSADYGLHNESAILLLSEPFVICEGGKKIAVLLMDYSVADSKHSSFLNDYITRFLLQNSSTIIYNKSHEIMSDDIKFCDAMFNTKNFYRKKSQLLFLIHDWNKNQYSNYGEYGFESGLKYLSDNFSLDNLRNHLNEIECYLMSPLNTTNFGEDNRLELSKLGANYQRDLRCLIADKLLRTEKMETLKKANGKQRFVSSDLIEAFKTIETDLNKYFKANTKPIRTNRPMAANNSRPNYNGPVRPRSDSSIISFMLCGAKKSNQINRHNRPHDRINFTSDHIGSNNKNAVPVKASHTSESRQTAQAMPVTDNQPKGHAIANEKQIKGPAIVAEKMRLKNADMKSENRPQVKALSNHNRPKGQAIAKNNQHKAQAIKAELKPNSRSSQSSADKNSNLSAETEPKYRDEKHLPFIQSHSINNENNLIRDQASVLSAVSDGDRKPHQFDNRQPINVPHYHSNQRHNQPLNLKSSENDALLANHYAGLEKHLLMEYRSEMNIFLSDCVGVEFEPREQTIVTDITAKFDRYISLYKPKDVDQTFAFREKLFADLAGERLAFRAKYEDIYRDLRNQYQLAVNKCADYFDRGMKMSVRSANYKVNPYDTSKKYCDEALEIFAAETKHFHHVFHEEYYIELTKSIARAANKYELFFYCRDRYATELQSLVIADLNTAAIGDNELQSAHNRAKRVAVDDMLGHNGDEDMVAILIEFIERCFAFVKSVANSLCAGIGGDFGAKNSANNEFQSRLESLAEQLIQSGYRSPQQRANVLGVMADMDAKQAYKYPVAPFDSLPIKKVNKLNSGQTAPIVLPDYKNNNKPEKTKKVVAVLKTENVSKFYVDFAASGLPTKRLAEDDDSQEFTNEKFNTNSLNRRIRGRPKNYDPRGYQTLRAETASVYLIKNESDNQYSALVDDSIGQYRHGMSNFLGNRASVDLNFERLEAHIRGAAIDNFESNANSIRLTDSDKFNRFRARLVQRLDKERALFGIKFGIIDNIKATIGGIIAETTGRYDRDMRDQLKYLTAFRSTDLDEMHRNCLAEADRLFRELIGKTARSGEEAFWRPYYEEFAASVAEVRRKYEKFFACIEGYQGFWRKLCAEKKYLPLAVRAGEYHSSKKLAIIGGCNFGADVELGLALGDAIDRFFAEVVRPKLAEIERHESNVRESGGRLADDLFRRNFETKLRSGLFAESEVRAIGDRLVDYTLESLDRAGDFGDDTDGWRESLRARLESARDELEREYRPNYSRAVELVFGVNKKAVKAYENEMGDRFSSRYRVSDDQFDGIHRDCFAKALAFTKNQLNGLRSNFSAEFVETLAAKNESAIEREVAEHMDNFRRQNAAKAVDSSRAVLNRDEALIELTQYYSNVKQLVAKRRDLRPLIRKQIMLQLDNTDHFIRTGESDADDIADHRKQFEAIIQRLLN